MSKLYPRQQELVRLHQQIEKELSAYAEEVIGGIKLPGKSPIQVAQEVIDSALEATGRMSGGNHVGK